MNRRNVINANTDRSRSSGGRRSGWFPPAFEPTARDLDLHVDVEDDGKKPLNERSRNETAQL